MTLDADVALDIDSFRLSVRIAAEDGEVIAVVGPNGSGKSTLLRGLAGLTGVRGSVRIDGVDVSDVAPDGRGVGWVPQDGALFPHLSAVDNVAFGLGGRAQRTQARAWLDRFGIAELGDRRPSQLSGGQAQKVALARALARRPRLLLLDEPLTALDVTARADVRRALRTHLEDFDGVTLFVTHDAVDATLTDRVVALDGGRVVQDDSPRALTRSPRTRWLAELMGANAFSGQLHGSMLRLEDGGELAVADTIGRDGAAALGVVPAHAVTLHREQPRGSARNAWPVVIDELSTTGSRVRVECSGRPGVVAEVTPGAVAELSLREGDEVWASVKATEITVVLL